MTPPCTRDTKSRCEEATQRSFICDANLLEITEPEAGGGEDKTEGGGEVDASNGAAAAGPIKEDEID